MSNWWNCWNLSEKVGIDQNAEIKSEKGKSVETRGQSWQSIKMLKLTEKCQINQNVEIVWFCRGF